LINWQSGQELGVPGYARVVGVIERQEGELDIELAISVDPASNQLKKSIIYFNPVHRYGFRWF